MKWWLQKGSIKQMAGETGSSIERNTAFKAELSLIVVWFTACSICLLFIFLSLPAQSNEMFAKNSTLLYNLQHEFAENPAAKINNGIQLSNENDAFVFVNINKQFFLTRFPSGRLEPADSESPEKETAAAATGSVIRKAKTTRKKTVDSDFSIKPVPR